MHPGVMSTTPRFMIATLTTSDFLGTPCCTMLQVLSPVFVNWTVILPSAQPTSENTSLVVCASTARSVWSFVSTFSAVTSSPRPNVDSAGCATSSPLSGASSTGISVSTGACGSGAGVGSGVGVVGTLGPVGAAFFEHPPMMTTSKVKMAKMTKYLDFID